MPNNETGEGFNEHFKELVDKYGGNSRFADIIGINRNTVAKYKNAKNTAADTGIVVLICKACNISADWLLGLSEVDKRDPDLRAACEYTRLSDKAVEVLHKREFDPAVRVRKYDESYVADAIRTVDIILSTVEGQRVLCDILEFLSASERHIPVDTDNPHSDSLYDRGGPQLLPDAPLYAVMRRDYIETEKLFDIRDALRQLKEKQFRQSCDESGIPVIENA